MFGIVVNPESIENFEGTHVQNIDLDSVTSSMTLCTWFYPMRIKEESVVAFIEDDTPYDSDSSGSGDDSEDTNHYSDGYMDVDSLLVVIWCKFLY